MRLHILRKNFVPLKGYLKDWITYHIEQKNRKLLARFDKMNTITQIYDIFK